jgi:hypothetical protein
LSRAAAPLPLADRDGFLHAIAEVLQGQAEIGDGALFRVLRETQARFWRPELDHAPAQGGRKAAA